MAVPDPESQGTQLPPERGPDNPNGAAATPRDIHATEAEVRPAQPPTVDTSTAPTAARPAGWPTVPGYEVLGVLGRGGMGVVYKARHLRLGRLVALKMIRDGILAGPDQMARFHLEAAAVARLRHPNIVQIYEIGEADARPFLSLELVEGGNLAQRLAGTPLPAPLATRLAETLARAVHHAHEAGIVHRDLKPANVLLAADGSPKVTDFGVAKHLEAEVFLTHTPSGVLLGTPSYMAPEQAWGKPREVGPCSDVYALGAILYELLTGQPPFLGERLMETLERVRSQEPVPPRRLQPRVPRDLETICLKCLQKDPHRRYGSAMALAEDLRRFGSNEPIQARRTPAWERALKWVRRRPAAAALFGVSALAAGLLAVVVLETGSLVRPVPQLAGVGRGEKDAVGAAPASGPAAATSAATKPVEQDEELALYAVRLAAAERARAAGNRAAAETALENCPPALRGWEWHYLRRLLGAAPGVPILRSHQGAATGLAFSPRGERLASGGLDQTAQLWDAATGNRLTLRGHGHAVLGVAFSPDGTRLAAVEGAGWRGPPDLRVPPPAPPDRRTAVPPRFPPRGGSLLAVKDAAGRPEPHPRNEPRPAPPPDAPDVGRLIVWDPATGKQDRVLPGPGRALTCVVYSPDGKWLVAGPGVEIIAPGHPVGPPGEGRRPGRRDAFARGPGPDLLAPFVVLMEPPQAVAAPVPPRAIDPGPAGSAIQVWDAQTGVRAGTLRGHTGAVAAVAFDPSGARLASAGTDGLLFLWDMTRLGDRPVSLASQHGAIHAVAFSPDGKRLAAAGADGAVHLWDPQSAREVQVLREHGDAVGCLAFSPDGKRLFSGGWDHTVRVWDATTGMLLLTLRTPATPTGVALGPGGNALAAAASDGAVRFWDATPQGRAESPFARLPHEADEQRVPPVAPAEGAMPPGPPEAEQVKPAPPGPPDEERTPTPKPPVTSPAPRQTTEKAAPPRKEK